MNLMQLQFSTYVRNFKRVFVWVPLVLFMSIVFLVIRMNGHGSYHYSDFNTPLILVLGFAFISLIAIPISNFKMLSPFMSFGITRKEFIFNCVVFNLVMSLVMSIIVNLTYFGQNLLYGFKMKHLYYCGIASLDHRFGTISVSILLYFGIFAILSSLTLLICAVRHTAGMYYGLSIILLVISSLLLFFSRIVGFIRWGALTSGIFISMFLIIVIVNGLSWLFTLRFEILE